MPRAASKRRTPATERARPSRARPAKRARGRGGSSASQASQGSASEDVKRSDVADAPDGGGSAQQPAKATGSESHTDAKGPAEPQYEQEEGIPELDALLAAHKTSKRPASAAQADAPAEPFNDEYRLELVDSSKSTWAVLPEAAVTVCTSGTLRAYQHLKGHYYVLAVKVRRRSVGRRRACHC